MPIEFMDGLCGQEGQAWVLLFEGKRGTLVLFVVSEAGSSWDTIHNPGE